MPYPNEHAARVRSPSGFSEFARKKIAEGIDVILGIKAGGESEVQAYRFKKDAFTAAEARAWLKDHKIEYIAFEAAASPVQAMIDAITGKTDV